MIPKITHQIWFQGWDKLPDKFKQNVSRLHDMNPEYEHKQWDEQSLRAECQKLGPAYVAKFDRLKYMICKIDFGRYVVLYNYGGISIDTDMEPVNPLRQISGVDKHDFIACSLPVPFLNRFINNAVFIVSRENSIMKDLIDTIVPASDVGLELLAKEIYVHFTTGPLVIMWLLRLKEIHILPAHTFEPCIPGLDIFCKLTDETIMNHKNELSWIRPSIQFIYRYLLIILMLIAVVFFVWPKHIVYNIGNDIQHGANSKGTDVGG
jgi:mannosyltransferase OCH1-like enzyme